jgi:hypothetical protein
VAQITALVEMSDNLLSDKQCIKERDRKQARRPATSAEHKTTLQPKTIQQSKVGLEEAKAWIEQRLAAMKNGVPKADAAELARDWLSSLEHNKPSGLDPRIAKIEAIDLAKQYTRGHV